MSEEKEIYAVKLNDLGEIKGTYEYLMSDGSKKTCRPEEVGFAPGHWRNECLVRKKPEKLVSVDRAFLKTLITDFNDYYYKKSTEIDPPYGFETIVNFYLDEKFKP